MPGVGRLLGAVRAWIATRSGAFWLFASVLFVPPLAILTFVLATSIIIRSEPVFSSDVTTEVLSVRTDWDPDPRRWFVSDSVWIDADSRPRPFSGQIAIGADVTIQLERRGLGPLAIVVEPNDHSGHVARLFPDTFMIDPRDGAVVAVEAVDTAHEFLAFEVRPDPVRPHLYPFKGLATLGQLIPPQISDAGAPILLEGKVQMLGKAPITGGRFAAGETTLEAGEVFFVVPDTMDGGREQRRGEGFVRVDDETPGVRLVYHAVGKRGRVVRVLSEGYWLKPTLWAYLSANPTLAIVGFLAVLLLPAVVQVAMDRFFAELRAPARRGAPPQSSGGDSEG